MRRDTLEKTPRHSAGIADHVNTLLEEIQTTSTTRPLRPQRPDTYVCDSYDDFKQRIEDGGFFLCHWDGTTETEELIKAETKATIRCIPLDGDETPPGMHGYRQALGSPRDHSPQLLTTRTRAAAHAERSTR